MKKRNLLATKHRFRLNVAWASVAVCGITLIVPLLGDVRGLLKVALIVVAVIIVLFALRQTVERVPISVHATKVVPRIDVERLIMRGKLLLLRIPDELPVLSQCDCKGFNSWKDDCEAVLAADVDLLDALNQPVPIALANVMRNRCRSELEYRLQVLKESIGQVTT